MGCIHQRLQCRPCSSTRITGSKNRLTSSHATFSLTKIKSIFISGEKPDDHKEEERMKDEELITVIDGIMKEEDLNQDGYIDYSEFVTAQRVQSDSMQKAPAEPPVEP